MLGWAGNFYSDNRIEKGRIIVSGISSILLNLIYLLPATHGVTRNGAFFVASHETWQLALHAIVGVIHVGLSFVSLSSL